MRVIHVIRELRGCDKSEEIFLVKKKKGQCTQIFTKRLTSASKLKIISKYTFKRSKYFAGEADNDHR